MRKGVAFTLVGVVLIAGLAAGYGVAGGFGSTGKSAVRNASARIGDSAPDFRLPDHKGGFVALSDFQGESNVVIAFYPLAWTPV
jgi:hypothetical protein